MVKKLITVLVLASMIAGGVFAQDNTWNGSFDMNSGATPQSGVLFVDLDYTIAYLILGGFGIGLGWEQRINDSSSWLIGGGFGMWEYDYGVLWGMKYNAFEFTAEASYRWYFFNSALDKLFINAGLGYSGLTWSYTYTGGTPDKTYTWGSLTIPLYAGWKAIIGPGFVVEADVGYRIGINIIKPDGYGGAGYSNPTFGGLIAGIRLGWAF